MEVSVSFYLICPFDFILCSQISLLNCRYGYGSITGLKCSDLFISDIREYKLIGHTSAFVKKFVALLLFQYQ